MTFSIKAYYALSKPGIIFGNLLSALGGFFLASTSTPFSLSLFPMLGGLSCIIASACSVNNYQDRLLDAKMKRTSLRPLVQGHILPRHALMYSLLLLTTGSYLLARHTNWITLFFALSGFCIYVFCYTPLKQYSSYATVVGSLAGATPPIVGYCCLSNQLDITSYLLFIIFVFWQMPHFFAIAIYRLKDYQIAAIPVLPIQKGIFATKKQMTLYLLAFTWTIPLLYLFHYTGLFYLVTMTLCNLLWLRLCVKGFTTQDDTLWAKQMFVFSLVTIVLFNSLLVLGKFL